MQVKHADIVMSAVHPDQYPNTNWPEIAVAGRSNVGKSSFINSLLNRKNLARTSSKPGKTRTINFFDINHQFYLVDVPGYGYAKVPIQEQEKWGQMMEAYFSARKQLRLAILLVDARHESQALDQQMYDYFVHYDIPVLVVGTKIDKVKKSQWHKHEQMIVEGLDVEDGDEVILYSSEKNIGRNDVRNAIAQYV